MVTASANVLLQFRFFISRLTPLFSCSSRFSIVWGATQRVRRDVEVIYEYGRNLGSTASVRGAIRHSHNTSATLTDIDKPLLSCPGMFLWRID
jgi:hypothetical protein